MTQEQALTILIQTAQLAQSKGALLLKEAVMVQEAIDVFTSKLPQKSEVLENPKEEAKKK